MQAVLLVLFVALGIALGYIHFMQRRQRAEAVRRAAEAQREQARSRVLDMLAQGAPLEELLDAIARGLEQEWPGVCCCIHLLDEAGTRLQAGIAPSLPEYFTKAFDGLEISLGAASAGTAAFTGQRDVVERIQFHPYWKDFSRLAQRVGVVSCWSEAIRFSSGKVLGVVSLYRREPHIPDEAEIRNVKHAVHLAEIALGRSHADRALRQHEHMLSDILENVRAHIYMKDTAGRYLFANRMMRERFAAPMEEITGYDDSKFFDAGAAAAIRAAERGVIEEGQPHEAEETLLNPLTGVTEVYLTVRIPLKREDGSIYGLCGISTDITERKDVEEHMQHMAQYDNLTHLPNRALFEDRLGQAIASARRAGKQLALMFVDLDRFKPVNDTYGHAVGDLLLKAVAERMQDCLRESDTAARIGGDEFVVLLPEVASAEDAEAVAAKLLVALGSPFSLAGNMVQIGGSIGLALFPHHGMDGKALVKSADAAMYRAKQQGRNNVQVFSA